MDILIDKLRKVTEENKENEEDLEKLKKENKKYKENQTKIKSTLFSDLIPSTLETIIIEAQNHQNVKSMCFFKNLIFALVFNNFYKFFYRI